MKGNIKACVFDLDGTLLNTLDGIAYHINAVLANHGIPSVTLEETKNFLGSGAKHLIYTVLASKGVTDESICSEVFAEYSDRYNASPEYMVEPYCGIPELLRCLRADGIKLAVLSNKPEPSTRALVQRHFADAFDIVRGGREGTPLKPAPDALLEILSELRIAPSECAFIGDGEHDVTVAHAIGAALPISVLWGFRSREQLESVGAHTFANVPSEIAQLLRNNGK